MKSLSLSYAPHAIVSPVSLSIPVRSECAFVEVESENTSRLGVLSFGFLIRAMLDLIFSTKKK